MAKIRRIVRKVQPAGSSVIDEQFWPVIVALFVMCGLLMGMAATYLPARAKHWWEDARFWLFAIPVVTCVLIWSLRYVDRRVVRRAVQVSIVIGLIFHLIFVVISLETSIFSRIWPEIAKTSTAKSRPLLVVAEYESSQLNSEERQQQDFVKPVETQVPDPLQEQVERQDTPEDRPPTETEPIPVPSTEPKVDRNIVERSTPAETVPRQSEQLSKLSRHTPTTQPSPASSVSAPQTAQPQPSAPTSLDSQTPSLQRRATNVPAPQMTAAPEPATVTPREVAAVSRRPTETTPTVESQSTPTLQRQVATPSTVPRTDLRTADAPTIARQTTPQALEASRTTTQRQTTAAPRVEHVASQPNVEQPTTVSQPMPRREQPAEPQPQLAQTPRAVPNRQARMTPRTEPATTATQVARDRTPAPSSTQELEASRMEVTRASSSPPTPHASPDPVPSNATATEPTATSVARRATPQAPAVAEATTQPATRRASAATSVPQTSSVAAATAAAEAGEAGGSALASGRMSISRQPTAGSAATAGQPSAQLPNAPSTVAQAVTRASTSTAPAGVPGASETSRLPRSAQSATVATARTAAETPSLVATESGADQPLTSPSRLAMTKSLSGTTGVGQSANLDRAPTTPSSPSPIASGAARRTEATQNMPAGPALTPSDAALARRMLAGTNPPGSPIEATTATAAETAGDRQPSELASSASASLSRNAANAKQGEITANPGNVEVDLGPTRVADAGGFDRAAGGGQPELNFDSEAKHLARNRSGGTAAVTLSTPHVGTQVAMPETTDQPAGGELAAAPGNLNQANTAAEVTATEMARTAGELAVAGTQNSEPQIGSAGLARTEARSDQPAVGEAGPGLSEEDEEEKKRRLARNRAAAALTASLAGPATRSEVPDAPETPNQAAGGDLAANVTASVDRTATASSGVGGEAATPEVAPPVPSTSGGGELVSETVVSRAEAVDAVTGPATLGGGTGGLQRSALATDFAANQPAPVASVAGATQSVGQPNGADATAQGVEPAATSNGVLSRPTVAAVGAAAGALPQDAVAQQGADALSGPATRAPAGADGPTVGDTPDVGAPLARANVARLNTSTTVSVTPGLPEAPTAVASADTDLGEGGVNPDVTPMERQSSGGLPLEIAAAEGPGGLGPQVALDVGINSRQALRDSIQIQSSPSRFIRKEVGGAPELSTAAIYSAEAFRRRGSRTPGDRPGGAAGAAGPQTEEAIELGLAFLARRQLPDGSWTLKMPGEEVALASDTAATGLTLLAFQGAGYNHREHKYAGQVAAGIAYLVKNQKPNGDLFVPVDEYSNGSVWLYSHAIAALALCEAYGMTHDPELAEPAQKAINFIVASQDKKGGGWRYQPGMESDTSVTGWMMMACKSGELAGLEVPRETYDGIRRWLDVSQSPGNERHLYRYNPYAPNTDTQRHGRLPSTTMTAVGLLMRLYSGWRRDRVEMIHGAQYLSQHLPAVGTVRDPKRDTYYWYYATQVMFHMGGEYWEQWNRRLHPLLIESQTKRGEMAGSWSPRAPVPDRWSPHAGRIYVTTMNLLSLEVSYRHLPLYVETAR